MSTADDVGGLHPQIVRQPRDQAQLNPLIHAGDVAGFGTEIQGVWHWYASWISRCIDLCGPAGGKYVAKKPKDFMEKLHAFL